MIASFEEKEYEGPLNHELLGTSSGYWPPGQVLEEHFGFDASLAVTNPAFWNAVNHENPLRGVILNDLRWGHVWRRYGKKHELPRFAVNLFIQAKRPKRLRNRRRELRELGLRSPYWRFDVTGHQQRALERVEQKVKRHAFVAYACPAFDGAADLFRHIHGRTLIVNSNFVRAGRLSDHDQWVYDAPGSSGIGCSEPLRMDAESVFDEVAAVVEEISGARLRTRESIEERESLTSPRSIAEASENLTSLAVGLREAIGGNLDDTDARRDEYMSRVNRIRRLELSPETAAFAEVLVFTELYNVSWLVAA